MILTSKQIVDYWKKFRSECLDMIKEGGISGKVATEQLRMVDAAIKALLDVKALQQENEQMKKRLQKSPYGDDKIDELEQALEFVKFNNEQLQAQILTDVVNSDLVKTYDGGALDKADQYIEQLEQENEQLKLHYGVACNLADEYGKVIQQLQTQNGAHMERNCTTCKHASGYGCKHPNGTGKCAGTGYLQWEPTTYHNPADVEALKVAREALNTAVWECTNGLVEVNEHTFCKVSEALAKIAEVVGE